MNIIANNKLILRYRIRFWITFNIYLLLFDYFFLISSLLRLLDTFYLLYNWLFILNPLNHLFLLIFFLRYSILFSLNLFLHFIYLLFDPIHLLFNSVNLFPNIIDLLFEFWKLIIRFFLFRRFFNLNDLMLYFCHLHRFLQFLLKQPNLFWSFVLNKAIFVLNHLFFLCLWK